MIVIQHLVQTVVIIEKITQIVYVKVTLQKMIIFKHAHFINVTENVMGVNKMPIYVMDVNQIINNLLTVWIVYKDIIMMLMIPKK